MVNGRAPCGHSHARNGQPSCSPNSIGAISRGWSSRAARLTASTQAETRDGLGDDVRGSISMTAAPVRASCACQAMVKVLRPMSSRKVKRPTRLAPEAKGIGRDGGPELRGNGEVAAGMCGSTPVE